MSTIESPASAQSALGIPCGVVTQQAPRKLRDEEIVTLDATRGR